MIDSLEQIAPWPLQSYSRAMEANRSCDAARGHASPTLNWLASLVCQRSGVVIGADRDYLLETRLQPLIQREGLADLAALVERMRHPAAETLVMAVVEAMTTNETLFFRDTKPFIHLANYGLSQVAASRPPGEPIRIWSAGSSSGQEAYSIAMVASERLDDHPIRILGTDIAAGPMERARAGVYTQYEVQRGLQTRRLLVHFDQLEVGWRVRAPLRAMCQFGIGNLLNDPSPLGLFDIIFCRNVLIYFDEPTKRMVLAALARQLAPDGWLYLGASETAAGLCPALQQSEPGWQIYRRAP
jgi:chemotaxis protein methyltransferase CheR